MESRLAAQIQKLGEMMASQSISIQQLLTEEQQESTDITTLATLVQTLLAAFANGNITQAQAQQLLTGMQSGDTTVTGLATSINAVINPVPAPSSSSSPAA
jgi:predicted XRE-type DNA-binding protein